MTRSRVVSALLGAALLVALLPVSSVFAGSSTTVPPIRIKHADLGKGNLQLDLGRISARVAARPVPRKVGAKHKWLAYDELNGAFLKNYRLRGRGRHIEVWTAAGSDEVSSGLKFPEGDCRNDERVRITRAQVRYLINEFDRNIYPKESRTFSVPPRRNGRNAILPELADLPADYFRGGRSGGDNIVVLVDNVRDESFYDTNNSQNHPYIAGFFATDFNEYLDRNVMTIDSYDWIHRTGGSPPNEPVPGDFCENKSGRPFLYEGVFAHEYQHLLESYEDPNEVTWLDEGLADWAQTFTGYVDTKAPVTDLGFDSHIQCFLGYLGLETPANPVPRESGPENSLNLWADQGAEEILCDYGAAYTMMEYLRDSFGKPFMTRLHRMNSNGFNSLQRNLTFFETGKTARQVIHEWIAMVALDGILDDGASFNGTADTYQVGTLDATINWDTAEAYSTPGAPPNGADFVRFRGPNGDYLSSGEVRTIEFDGAEQLVPLPIEWTVDSAAPGQTDDPALYSGNGDNFDRAIVRQVSVPQDNANLTFNTRYSMEEGYDYGYVEVSTDGGETYERLSNAHTVEEGGFNGDSGCPVGNQAGGSCEPQWLAETFNLAAYAGQDVLVAFRYVTDGGVFLPGWWIDDVAIGGTVLSDGSTLDGWQTPTQVNPVEVDDFTVQLVAYTDDHQVAYLAELPLGEGFTGSMDGDTLAAAIGADAETIAAIVMYDDPTEEVGQYAPYVLTVNNKVQDGGS